MPVLQSSAYACNAVQKCQACISMLVSSLVAMLFTTVLGLQLFFLTLPPDDNIAADLAPA